MHPRAPCPLLHDRVLQSFLPCPERLRDGKNLHCHTTVHVMLLINSLPQLPCTRAAEDGDAFSLLHSSTEDLWAHRRSGQWVQRVQPLFDPPRPPWLSSSPASQQQSSVPPALQTRVPASHGEDVQTELTTLQQGPLLLGAGMTLPTEQGSLQPTARQTDPQISPARLGTSQRAARRGIALTWDMVCPSVRCGPGVPMTPKAWVGAEGNRALCGQPDWASPSSPMPGARQPDAGCPGARPRSPLFPLSGLLSTSLRGSRHPLHRRDIHTLGRPRHPPTRSVGGRGAKHLP